MPGVVLKGVVVGLALMLGGHAAGSSERQPENRPRFDADTVPDLDPSVGAFVPLGWTIEARVEGDLDRDAVDDIVLTLVEDLPAEDAQGIATDRRRALVVLLNRDGGFIRAGSNSRLLQCTRCGGGFYGMAETPVEVMIERGVIIVRQDFGARDMTAETHRFRYDPTIKRFLLIGYDVYTLDRLGPMTVDESTNLLTGDRIRRETRSGETADDEVVIETRDKIGRKSVFLEDAASLNSE